MFSVFKFCFALLFTSILLLGCDTTDANDDSDPDPVTLEATLSSIQANIFTSSCATAPCHDSNNPQRGLDLTSGTSFSAMVNVASRDIPSLLLVNPSNADSSYLVWKLEGTAGILGDRMPSSGGFLSDSEVTIIRQWIDAGALNN